MKHRILEAHDPRDAFSVRFDIKITDLISDIPSLRNTTSTLAFIIRALSHSTPFIFIFLLVFGDYTDY